MIIVLINMSTIIIQNVRNVVRYNFYNFMSCRICIRVVPHRWLHRLIFKLYNV